MPEKDEKKTTLRPINVIFLGGEGLVSGGVFDQSTYARETPAPGDAVAEMCCNVLYSARAFFLCLRRQALCVRTMSNCR
jgi:hypothetical protein